MPYASAAQRRFFNANRTQLEAQGVDVGEWNSQSRGLKLPERIGPIKRRKPNRNVKKYAPAPYGLHAHGDFRTPYQLDLEADAGLALAPTMGHGVVLASCGCQVRSCRCPAFALRVYQHPVVKLDRPCHECMEKVRAYDQEMVTAASHPGPPDRAAGGYDRVLNEVVRIGDQDYIVKDLASDLEEAREQVEPEPSEAQKEAGNYRKGHVTIQGLGVAIENPKGSVRSGVDHDGNEWRVQLKHDYGYIKRTEGADGDHVDVFIGPDHDSDRVWVVDQLDHDGNFDEHKCMLCFRDQDSARAGYLANYSPGWGDRIGEIREMPLEEFRSWLRSTDTALKKFNPNHGDGGRFASGSGVLSPQDHLPPDLAEHHEHFRRGAAWAAAKLRPGDREGVKRMLRNARDRVKYHDAIELHHRGTSVGAGHGNQERAYWRGVLAHVEQARSPIRKFNPNHDQAGRFATAVGMAARTGLEVHRLVDTVHYRPVPVENQGRSDWHEGPGAKQLIAKFDEAADNPFADQNVAPQVRKAAFAALSRMSSRSVELINGWLKGVTVGNAREIHKIQQDIVKAEGKRVRKGGVVAGFVKTGGDMANHVFLSDGRVKHRNPRKLYGHDDAAHVAAHELGHVLDFAHGELIGDKGRAMFINGRLIVSKQPKLSNHPEWYGAWASEMQSAGKDRITRYAKTSPGEGFAEFCRLMTFEPEKAKRDFPQCWKFWSDRGIP